MKANRIYHGDNMYFMPDMPSESIDLIYIDPPFGTQSLWKSKAFKEKVQDLQFYDIFGGGVNGYVNFLKERLIQMHRLLKPTGSLFVHLDWRMSHYIKIELDKIFGVKNPSLNNTNFVNEIVWYYENASRGKNNLAYSHDVILWYSKNRKFLKFNRDKILVKFKSNMTYWRYTKGGQKGKIIPKGKTPDNVIVLPSLNAMSKERTGWPTQKPLKLLDKIIIMASDKNDLIADLFCGCGTAIVSAQRLNRKWIGMDASQTACEVMLERIRNDQPLFNHGIISKPMKGKDFSKLPPLDFEKAAVRYIGGVTNHAQTADGGIDGRLAFDGTPIQVKKSDKPIGDDDKLRAFYLPLKQHGRGVYISYKGYTLKAKERASSWRREGLDIQLLSIQDILAGKFREQPKQSRLNGKAV